jgi:catechol 2,3-dioxygenase-like lactoylglutathione lyase family enzyme
MANRPQPSAGMALTHFIVRSDISRSRHFYVDVLGGEILLDGEPTIVALANSWIIINRGGPPTDDKPTVTLEPPRDLRVVNAFLNIRAADIYNLYEQWQARGAALPECLPDRGVQLRCYLRDPDGHLIEVGQTLRQRGSSS